MMQNLNAPRLLARTRKCKPEPEFDLILKNRSEKGRKLRLLF